jgi:hypothetical protein
MLSSFGGTIALGGLISLTLLFGMLSNLMLLPALVLTLNKTLANEQEFIEPESAIGFKDGKAEVKILFSTLKLAINL